MRKQSEAERKKVRSYGIRGITRRHQIKPGRNVLTLPESAQVLTVTLEKGTSEAGGLFLYTLEPQNHSISHQRHFQVCQTDEVIAPGWWNMNQWIASVPVPGIVGIWHVYELLEMER